MRRRRSQFVCNVAIFFACWPLAGIVGATGSLCFIFLVPMLTRLFAHWGMRSTVFSDVEIGPLDMQSVLFGLTLISLLGGVGVAIALPVASRFERRRPRRTRTIQMLAKSLIYGFVPWTIAVLLIEAVLLALDSTGLSTGTFFAIYVVLGPMACVLIVRLARNRWRAWKRMSHPQFPSVPCARCGYDLRKLQSQRCPECGTMRNSIKAAT